MATSGSWTGSRTVSYGPQLKLSWSRTDVDIPNNRSKVKLTLELYAGYSVYFSASKSGSLHGSGFTYTGGFSGTGTKTIRTREFWVNHNSDGSKSFSVSAWLDVNISMSAGYVSRISVSGTISLDTIPRESKLTSFKVYNSLSPSTSCRLDLSITRYSSSFRHTIEVKHGSTSIATWTGQGTPSSLSLTGSQVNALLKRLSSSTTGTLTMVISTHNGSTRIGGYSSRSATATVNSGVKPSISGFSISIDGNGRDMTIGKFVQNISRVHGEMSRSAGYGASVSSSSILIRKDSNHANSMTINSHSGTSGTLTSNGLYEAIATVRDSRGRTTTSRTTFTVEAYSKPKITKFSAERDATTDTTVNITRNGTYTPLGTDNPTDIVLSKRVSGGSWTTITGGLAQHTSGSFGATKTNTGNSTTSSYEFRLTVTDSFNNTAEAIQIVSTARVAFDIHKNDGVGIGKMHERGVLDVDGNAYFNGHLFVNDVGVSKATSFGDVTIPVSDTIKFWQDLPQGTYFVSRDQIPNQPSNYGVMIHTTQASGSGSDFSTLWYTQASGTVFRKSGNRSSNNDWIPIDRPDVGSNSNGTWVKFNDGTMICYRQTSETFDISNSTNGGQARRTDLFVWAYPAEFTSSPTVSVNTHIATGYPIYSYINGSAGHYVNYRVALPAPIDLSLNGYVHHIAVGRWK